MTQGFRIITRYLLDKIILHAKVAIAIKSGDKS
jgi:hypothetical protein